MLTVCILYYSLSVSVCLSALHIVCFTAIWRINVFINYIYTLEEPIIKILYGAKNGVHAFVITPPKLESKPIRMKFGAL